jgi:hypothetical protein
MAWEMQVVDWKNQEITVGCRCLYGTAPPFNETDENGLSWEDYVVVVKSISDPDGDYDDTLGRGVLIPPYVHVEFPSGEKEGIRSNRITPITWADYPDGPSFELFQVDDLEVLEDNVGK